MPLLNLALLCLRCGPSPQHPVCFFISQCSSSGSICMWYLYVSIVVMPFSVVTCVSCDTVVIVAAHNAPHSFVTVCVLWLCSATVCSVTVCVLWLCVLCDCVLCVLWLCVLCDRVCSVTVCVMWLCLFCDCVCSVTVCVMWMCVFCDRVWLCDCHTV